MNYLTTFFLLITLGCASSNKDNLSIENTNYQKALNLMSKSEEFLSLDKKNYQVHGELISYKVFANFFNEYLNLDLSTIIMEKEELIVKSTDASLTQLSLHMKSKNHIFFSTEKNDFFFIELLALNDRKLKYSERPDFGYSYVFLFKKSKEIELVAIKKMIYG